MNSQCFESNICDVGCVQEGDTSDVMTIGCHGNDHVISECVAIIDDEMLKFGASTRYILVAIDRYLMDKRWITH